MSTFPGTLAEIPGISIDRFDGKNLDSEAFFLSHCHTDHMRGLDSSYFHKILIENNLFIYLSHVSAEILKKTHPPLSSNLIELDFHSATIITLKDKSIAVTPIPAGHCPGSVMFLFEADENVLYTGDFRLNPADIPKFKAFFDSMNNQKKIDAIYLDTTFFLKEYEKFPSRAESLDEICRIIKNWIDRSKNHVIALKTPAKYGYEYLFMEVYKQLKMPVHVNDDIYEFYSRVPELDQAVTRDKNNTRIHSACGIDYTIICCTTSPYIIKEIRVTAMRWTSNNLQKSISESLYNVHYVCYSTHASYEEAAALLKFLKPKRAEASVLYQDFNKNAKILANIEEIVATEGPKKKKVKLFQIDEEKSTRSMGDNYCRISSNSVLDSPPRFKLEEDESPRNVSDCCCISSNSILDSPPRKFAP